MTTDNGSATSVDWHAWHVDYDTDSPLRRRLQIVQRHIGDFLSGFDDSPVRVVSLCAGEARDLLGAVERVTRRDLVGRLVELDPVLSAAARSRAEKLGLVGVECVVGDAGHSAVYAGAVPADLVLACGVFGNISDEDVDRTVKALPMLSARGATVIWTRNRREPDLTVSIRRWLGESGFQEVAFEPVPDSLASVGVARYIGATEPLRDERLFTFTRTRL